MKSLFLFSFLTIFLTASASGDFEIHVTDRIRQGSLRIHCASGDDDLGYHNLYNGQEIMWKFNPDIFGRTIYFCHFWWGKQSKRFDVYNKRTEDQYVYWLATRDGFYYADHNAPFPSDQWSKKYDWI